MLSTTTLLLVTAIIFLASFILGITSFGFALVAVPLLNLIFPLQVLVPVLIIYGVFINGLVLLPIYKHLDLKGMQYLVGAGILGVPLGTYLLLILDESILKISIGIIIIISAWALYTGYRVNIKNQNLGNAVAGFISGLLNGSLTMSGPPVILFYSNQNLKSKSFGQIWPFILCSPILSLCRYSMGEDCLPLRSSNTRWRSCLLFCWEQWESS